METIVNFILSGNTEFNPEVLIRLFVFCLTLDTLGFIARAIMSVGK